MTVFLNLIRLEHRGSPPCSLIPFKSPVSAEDWVTIFNTFNSERVLEDIEFVRAKLLGDHAKVSLFGSSGGGILAAQYAARYPNFVARVAIGIAAPLDLRSSYRRA